LKNAPYHSGRSTDWLKSKCSARQEFVIAGYVPSTTSKTAIGSLVLGYYDKDKLVYVGRVGTGFSEVAARELYSKLQPDTTKENPYQQKLSPDQVRGVRWVKPKFVAEIEFRGWTAARNLRHASYRGLRDDKPIEDISREDANIPSEVAIAASAAKPHGIKLTHPDRIYWPDDGVTKQGLAEYYSDVWKWMAPHIVGRPLALVRCPEGISGECFFQKAAWKGINRNIDVLRNRGVGGEQVLAIHNLDGLIALVQAGVLEIHPWGSTIADWSHPDRLIFDLDPGPGVGWMEVVNAANEVRQRLEHDHRLKSFVKTSGGKGLHVIAPIEPAVDWDYAKAFTRSIAETMTRDSPGQYTATMAKKERTGRIFIDYLRNGQGATAIAPYSTRARAGAPVSTPISWEELGVELRADQFGIANIMNRLSQLKTDPWSEFFKMKQSITDPASVLSKGKSKRK
jgi:bifunctional non-homologous end joining protein LigD